MAVAKEEQEPAAAPSASDPSEVSKAIAPRWIRRLISERHQPTLLGHMVITGTLLAAAGVVSIGLFSYASQKQYEWLSFDRHNETEEQAKVLANNVRATTAERERMVDQFLQVQRRLDIHARVMGLFYKLNFISLGLISVSVGVASISLFFISKQGWEQSNNALINIFMVSSGLVVFHSNLILIFKYQDNIKINQKLLANYAELRNTMLSYWATQPTLEGSMVAAEFIYQIDGKLAALGTIALDFNTEQASRLRQPIDYLPGSAEAVGEPEK